MCIQGSLSPIQFLPYLLPSTTDNRNFPVFKYVALYVAPTTRASVHNIQSLGIDPAELPVEDFLCAHIVLPACHWYPLSPNLSYLTAHTILPIHYLSLLIMQCIHNHFHLLCQFCLTIRNIVCILMFSCTFLYNM